VRQASLGTLSPEMFDGVMECVRGQSTIGASPFELLRANLGAEMHREASRSAMLIERSDADTGAAETKYDGSAFIAGAGEEFTFETIEQDGAFGPHFACALGGKAADRTRQLAHQRLARARPQRDDSVVLDPHVGSELFGQKVAQIDRKATA
jgi:hypothetical protein